MKQDRKMISSRPGNGYSIAALSFFLTGVLLLAGCGEPFATAPYAVVDTGVWPSDYKKPIWLDNQRVIFTSTETLTPSPKHQVVVWDTDTRQLTKTPLTKDVICGRAGSIFYVVKDETSGKRTYYRGALENAKEHPAPGSDMWMDVIHDCDWVPEPPPDRQVPYRSKLVGKNNLEIIERRHKLFEYQKRPADRKHEQVAGENLGPDGKRRYHRDDSDPGRDIPSGHISYSEFLDAYVVGHSYYSPKWAETRSFWILQRDGDLKQVPYPKTMSEGTNVIHPISLGYLVVYHTDPMPGADKFNSAIYLMQNGQLHRLVAGSIHHVSISANGCKAAFVHSRNVKELISDNKPYRTVKYINFCQGRATP